MPLNKKQTRSVLCEDPYEASLKLESAKNSSVQLAFPLKGAAGTGQ